LQAGPAQSLSAALAPAPTSTPKPTPHPSALTLDHQQRFFTGWGDNPPSHLYHASHSHPPDHNLKTPSLGLVWANQIACRVALVKEAAYLRQGDRASGTNVANDSSAAGEAARPGVAAAAAGARDGTSMDPGADRAEWAPRTWRRWMRVVFAPWVAGVRAGEKGVEFEVWKGGVRAVGA
ncbi:hypothetical protein MMC18_008736, partial [Xylographa bjoerkii]|nr:hypothetical protein [Xylographa bjoerkii]